jgi:hypothetical protein
VRAASAFGVQGYLYELNPVPDIAKVIHILRALSRDTDTAVRCEAHRGLTDARNMRSVV